MMMMMSCTGTDNDNDNDDDDNYLTCISPARRGHPQGWPSGKEGHTMSAISSIIGHSWKILKFGISFPKILNLNWKGKIIK